MGMAEAEEVVIPLPEYRSRVPLVVTDFGDDEWEGFERDEAEEPDAVYDDNSDDPRTDDVDGPCG